MKYGIIQVEDCGARGATNSAEWALRKAAGGANLRAEFGGDAEARAYIRDILLPKTDVRAHLRHMRAQGFTTLRAAPARHWVFYAWPLPAGAIAQEEPSQQVAQGPTPSARANDRVDAASDRAPRLL